VATAGQRRRGRGHPRRDPSPPPALDQSEDHVAATGTTTDTSSGDSEEEAARQTDEGTQQTDDSSARSTPYLRGPTSLPPILLPDRRPVLRPVGRK
jgi:hypothetical protein